jgi:hypothetical protein
MAHLHTVIPQPPRPPSEPPQELPDQPAPPPPPGPRDQPARGWDSGRVETREVRKARERADRAARRAGRAAGRVREAEEREAAQRSGTQQLVDAAGDAATAALTAVSAAADEAQARLAARARMRDLEHALVTARAGGLVDVSPPTREEALKLADQADPGSTEASFVRGLGFIFAGIAALAMVMIGGFGWLGFMVPMAFMVAGGALGDRMQQADRSRKAASIQLQLARASLTAADRDRSTSPAHQAQGVPPTPTMARPASTAAPITEQPRLREDGDPQTRAEVVAVLDRVIEKVRELVPEAEMATLLRIRNLAALALPATDTLDLTSHDTWQLRQICIDYVPGALEHYIALPSDLATEPMLDGRSARQVLDEQLALIESRLGEMVTRSYRREAAGLLSHARFLADTLRRDPFQAQLAELAAKQPEPAKAASPQPAQVAAPEPAQVASPELARAVEAPVVSEETVTRERERA